MVWTVTSQFNSCFSFGTRSSKAVRVMKGLPIGSTSSSELMSAARARPAGIRPAARPAPESARMLRRFSIIGAPFAACPAITQCPSSCLRGRRNPDLVAYTALSPRDGKQKKWAAFPCSPFRLEGGCRSALRILEAASRAGAAVLLALHHAAVAGQIAASLERAAQRRLVMSQRPADAVADGTGLAGEPAAGDGGDDVILAQAIGHAEGLCDHHAQHWTREIDRALAAVDGDLAAAGLQPDAGDGVFAPTRGVGAALGIDLRLAGLGGRLCRLGGGAQVFQVGQGLGLGAHAAAILLFLRFIAATSSVTGCWASWGWLGPA